MDKQKLVNILGAGTVTGIVMIMMLAFGGGWSGPVMADSASTVTDNMQVVPLDSYNTLQQENDQLQTALDTMIDRESQYQNQLDQANQLLSEAAAPSAYEEYEDEEEYEGEEEYEDDEAYEAEEEDESYEAYEEDEEEYESEYEEEEEDEAYEDEDDD